MNCSCMGFLKISVAAILGLALLSPNWAGAVVTGECANCHTMHNSQNGSNAVHAGSGAAWNNGQVAGGSVTAPQETLLVTDCVGCHSNSGAETIVSIGSSRIPIVYNMVEPDGSSIATTPLAGGNFYWAVANGDAYGHNVAGISSQDATLAKPPGTLDAFLCAPCHYTLSQAQATSPYGWGPNKGGCEACHVPRHHANGNSTVVGRAEGWYRFLGSAMYRARNHVIDTPTGVVGIEDDDWGQTTSPTDHNVYQGALGTGNKGISGGVDEGSIAQICRGCHGNFHHDYSSGEGGMLDAAGFWIRHPAEILIPDTGEYAGLTEYNPLTPVGRTNVTDGDINFVTIDHDRDVVTCISCHMPHGSPYPDMLRWDYDGMLAHDANAANGTGCFYCHTTKDEI